MLSFISERADSDIFLKLSGRRVMKIRVGFTFFVFYILSGFLGVFCANLPPGNLTVIWLPAGIALALLLKTGAKGLPWIFIGSYLINTPFLIKNYNMLDAVRPLLAGLFLAGADTLQGYLAFKIFKHLKLLNPFTSGREVLRFFFMVAFLPCASTTWILVVVLHLFGICHEHAAAHFFNRSAVLALADTLGISLALPIYFSCKGKGLRAILRTTDKKFYACLGLLLFFLFASNAWLGEVRFLIFPLLLYVVITMDLKAISVSLLITAFYSICATAMGYGPYVGESTLESYTTMVALLLCLFLAFMYTQGLLSELKKEQRLLEGKVLQRTRDLEQSNRRLNKTLEEVKTLSGILPICANCHKIRDDKGYWQRVESYLAKHSDAQFSHGLCPDCARKLYPDMFDDEDLE